MKEKFQKVKDYVIDNGEMIAEFTGLSVAVLLGFGFGRITQKGQITVDVTQVDKSGNILREVHCLKQRGI